MVESQGQNGSGKTPACVLKHLTTLMWTHTTITEYAREQSFHLTLKKTRLGFVRVPPTERTIHVNLFCAISEASNSVPVSSKLDFQHLFFKAIRNNLRKQSFNESEFEINPSTTAIYMGSWGLTPINVTGRFDCKKTISQHSCNRHINYCHKHYRRVHYNASVDVSSN